MKTLGMLLIKTMLTRTIQIQIKIHLQIQIQIVKNYHLGDVADDAVLKKC